MGAFTTGDQRLEWMHQGPYARLLSIRLEAIAIRLLRAIAISVQAIATLLLETKQTNNTVLFLGSLLSVLPLLWDRQGPSDLTETLDCSEVCCSVRTVQIRSIPMPLWLSRMNASII